MSIELMQHYQYNANGETLAEQLTVIIQSTYPAFDEGARKRLPDMSATHYHVNLTHNVTMAWVAFAYGRVSAQIGQPVAFKLTPKNYCPGEPEYAPLHTEIYRLLAFSPDLPKGDFLYGQESFEAIWHEYLAPALQSQGLSLADVPNIAQEWAERFSATAVAPMKASCKEYFASAKPAPAPHRFHRMTRKGRRN